MAVTNELIETLRTVEFLADCGFDVVLRFASLGRLTVQPKGHVLWRVGTPANEIVVPVTGEVEMVNDSAEGREFIDRFIGPGECIGLVSAVDGLPHPQEARVVRGGEFFVMERGVFLRLLDEHPRLRPAVHESVGRLYRRTLREREDVMAHHVDRRLAAFLLRHACVRHCDGARILLHATHSEIASRIGSVREVVARTFAAFRRRGLVERSRKALFIVDWNGLCAEAACESGSTDDTRNALFDPTPQLRTRRFFLESRDRRRQDAGACLHRLEDLSLCRARGCTAAIELVTPHTPV